MARIFEGNDSRANTKQITEICNEGAFLRQVRRLLIRSTNARDYHRKKQSPASMAPIILLFLNIHGICGIKNELLSSLIPRSLLLLHLPHRNTFRLAFCAFKKIRQIGL